MKRHADVPYKVDHVFWILTDTRAFKHLVPGAASCTVQNPHERTRAQVTIHMLDGTKVPGKATHWLPPHLFILTLDDGRRILWSLESNKENSTRVVLEADATQVQLQGSLNALQEALATETAAAPTPRSTA